MSSILQNLSQEFLPAIEAEMRAVLNAEKPASNLFDGMIHYHLGWADEKLEPVQMPAGKRIRPLLCLLCCQAAGGDWRQAVPAAASIEILHNFTLIHDDIQDNSPTRRGRPTVWKLWGVAQAINSGDAMFAQSHLAMSRLMEKGVNAGIVVHALRRLDETCLALTKGQFADMDFETRPNVSVNEYMEMITGKTAVLVELAAELGALIAGKDDNIVHHYAQFARHLGLAFQVRDDILGIWGEEAAIGKSAATDIETRKKSLPVLYGLEKNEEFRHLYQQNPAPPDFVAEAIALLGESSARQYTESIETGYTQIALKHLEETNCQGNSLAQLANYLLGRIA